MIPCDVIMMLSYECILCDTNSQQRLVSALGQYLVVHNDLMLPVSCPCEEIFLEYDRKPHRQKLALGRGSTPQSVGSVAWTQRS